MSQRIYKEHFEGLVQNYSNYLILYKIYTIDLNRYLDKQFSSKAFFILIYYEKN